ncbi:hypothetical protein [Ruegeria atlantica]|uniref:hypothetical protein n=1 Tax=Ruegeria atlantica TaxID=81569 RepID=UPI0024944D33|nr:hypothetical protein [Ruegeria atlantica]
MRAHDLGASRLVPVDLLHLDQGTKLEGDWFYFLLGDGKPCFQEETSKGMKPLGRKKKYFWPETLLM